MRLEQAARSLFEKNDGWSTYTSLACALVGKRYSTNEIKKVFNKFVDKDDYSKRDKDNLLRCLGMLTSLKFETNA